MPDVDGLLTPPDVRRLLADRGLAPRKTAGQNFVVDPNTVRRIVDAADLAADDTVLEVGPGLGSLTRLLVQRVAAVVAVELDHGFVELLADDPELAALAGGPPGVVDGAHRDRPDGRTVDREQLGAAADDVPTRPAADPPGVSRGGPGPTAPGEGRPGGSPSRLTIVAGDALTVDVGAVVPDGTRVVANLPYNVATPIVMTLLRVEAVRDQLVMVQREVGERWVAGPGDAAYGAVSAKLALAADVAVAFPVSRQVFVPVPNVDSVMVRVVHRPDRLPPARREHVLAVVDAAFAQRRKTLRNNLRAIATQEAVVAACAAAGVDPGARADACTPDELAAIAAALPPDA